MYVRVRLRLRLQPARDGRANTLFARIPCVPHGCVSCHRSPWSGSILGFARSLARSLALTCLPKPRLRAFFIREGPERRGDKTQNTLSKASCSFSQLSVPLYTSHWCMSSASMPFISQVKWALAWGSLGSAVPPPALNLISLPSGMRDPFRRTARPLPLLEPNLR